MQSTPTSSLLGGRSPRLRAGITFFHAGLFAGLLALGACHDPKVTTYRVPKDADVQVPTADAQAPAMAAAPAEDPHANVAPAAPLAAAPAGMAASPHAMAAGASLTWTAPAGWQAKQVGSMRKATYELSGAAGATAELAISAFPGDVGGDIANVNRWRGQVGLNTVSDAEAAAAIQHIDANGLKIGVVDLVDKTAAEPVHLLGAMVPFDGSTWFFKLVGPDAVVSAQKTAFVEFLKTVKPAAPAQS